MMKDTWLRWLAAGAACALLGACGGDTDDSDDHDGNDGGAESGGRATGGRATGGSTTGGSTPGGAGPAGAESGGTEQAGAPASGGAGPGGGAEAGPGGALTGGTEPGGAPATGGTSGSAGTGGTGDGGSPPVTLCDDFCEVALAAGCDSPATASECLSECAIMTNVGICSAEIEATLDCYGNAPTHCDENGEVAFEGCLVEEATLLVCIGQAEPPEELEEPCTAWCENVADADCPADDPATCVEDCGMIGLLAPDCLEVYATAITCGSNDTLTCNEDGEAEPTGCTVEMLAALGCIASALGGAP